MTLVVRGFTNRESNSHFLEVLRNSFDSSCSVSETSNLQEAAEYYEAKTKEENHSVLMRKKTFKTDIWLLGLKMKRRLLESSVSGIRIHT